MKPLYNPNRWVELFPDGRVIIYEGNEPDKFCEDIKKEFEFDPSEDERWDAENEHARWFFCPPEHLDAIYGAESNGWQVGS